MNRDTPLIDEYNTINDLLVCFDLTGLFCETLTFTFLKRSTGRLKEATNLIIPKNRITGCIFREDSHTLLDKSVNTNRCNLFFLSLSVRTLRCNISLIDLLVIRCSSKNRLSKRTFNSDFLHNLNLLFKLM